MEFQEAITLGSQIILKHEYDHWKGNPEDIHDRRSKFSRGALGFSIKLQEKVELDSMNHVITQCEDFSK
jgi:hypothetical protein